MSDELLEAIPMLAVLVELFAMGWAFARQNVNGLVLVNVLGAAALMFLVVPELAAGLRFVDAFSLMQLILLAFALATLTTSVSWLARPVSRSLAVWTEFSLMTGLSVTLAAAVLLLKVAHLA